MHKNCTRRFLGEISKITKLYLIYRLFCLLVLVIHDKIVYFRRNYLCNFTFNIVIFILIQNYVLSFRFSYIVFLQYSHFVLVLWVYLTA